MKELQIINSLLGIATIPFALHLFLRLYNQEDGHADIIKYVLMMLSATIIATMVISLHINYSILVKGIEVKDILFEANVRNLIKNATLFAMTVTFWHIRK